MNCRDQEPKTSFSVLLHPEPAQRDYLIADLAECGTLGIVEDNSRLRAFFPDTADSQALLNRFAAFQPELQWDAPVDWARVSRDAWPPAPIGQRFYLVPPWFDGEVPAGRLRLTINPGMACGTGRHPATRLCLQAIEQYVQPGAWVLDVGTGSGILSQAALLMGADRVIGCDIDSQSIESARQISDARMFIGSADAVRDAWADVIVANIDSATIEGLAHELARVRKPQSKLILSGFPDWDVPEGFNAVEILALEEWRCLIC